VHRNTNCHCSEHTCTYHKILVLHKAPHTRKTKATRPASHHATPCTAEKPLHRGGAASQAVPQCQTTDGRPGRKPASIHRCATMWLPHLTRPVYCLQNKTRAEDAQRRTTPVSAVCKSHSSNYGHSRLHPPCTVCHHPGCIPRTVCLPANYPTAQHTHCLIVRTESQSCKQTIGAPTAACCAAEAHDNQQPCCCSLLLAPGPLSATPLADGAFTTQQSHVDSLLGLNQYSTYQTRSYYYWLYTSRNATSRRISTCQPRTCETQPHLLLLLLLQASANPPSQAALRSPQAHAAARYVPAAAQHRSTHTAEASTAAAFPCMHFLPATYATCHHTRPAVSRAEL
jgi:hypothetical protein